MKRKLSSNKTFGLKILLPAVVTAFSGELLFFLFFGSVEQRLRLGPMLLWLPVFLIIITAVCRLARKFKVVRVDDDFLYASNYLKEISIPLLDISDVTGMASFKGAPVTIHLKTNSAFGRKITFTPEEKGLNPFAAQTIVSDLKQLAKIN